MKEKALVVCPGRGTYNATELGYLNKYHAGQSSMVKSLDLLRNSQGQITISELDGAEKFFPSIHMTGDNASLLIYACALADFAAIDRERYDVVAVTGNSMGWYLALSCAGIIDFDKGALLVNNMGALMHSQGTGGQIVWPIVDADWNLDPQKQVFVAKLLEEASTNSEIRVYTSIRLGGMIVFAADAAGLGWLHDRLPKDDRFPMRLMHHAAFHSPLLEHIVPLAQKANPIANFTGGLIPAIDGFGKIWSPRAFDIAQIYSYTLGAQLTQAYDFTKAVQVAAAEFAPDKIIVLGPGTTLGAPTAQALIARRWRGLSGRIDFQKRQASEPLILSMGIAEQREMVVA
ncbi:MAG: ACP S-malonyltransferase [Sphingorhabdus sp.]